MKLNFATRSIAGAEGWFARYGRNRRPLLCWAVTDDGLAGLILGAGGDARNAEMETVDGQQFTDYEHLRPGQLI
jgi:hypothetical protein